MIYKRTEISADMGDHPKSFVVGNMEKTASLQTHIPQKLQKAIQKIENSSDQDHSYLYDRALGAGECYGPNNNGDFFGRDELKKHHGTFVTNAHVFRHHKNKDPSNKVGDIAASAYNDPLDTVDLILKLPTGEVQDDLRKLDQGQIIATSMGAKVPYDICSICGNKAKSRALYCKHAKNRMLDILPGGRQVFVKNPRPKFKDLSLVVVPAAPESGAFRKIAHKEGQKEGSIKKEVPNMNDSGRGVIKEEVLDQASKLDSPSAIKTLDQAYGPLRPDEFKAVLNKDASLIRPDQVPLVPVRPTESRPMRGKAHEKMASLFERVDFDSIEEEAEEKVAQFLDSPEQEAYLSYRRGDESRSFLR